MAGGMKLDGLPELLKALSSAGKIAHLAGRAEMDAVAEEIAEGARQRAPIDSGKLRDEIAVHPEVLGPDRYKIQVGLDEAAMAEVPYAEYMHEGWGSYTPYKLGPGSLAASTAAPHVGAGVGWKFLERAFESAYRSALRRVNNAMSDGLLAGWRSK